MEEIKGCQHKEQKIFVGLDVHKKSWSVSVYYENSCHKTFSQPPDPATLYNYLHKTFPEYRYYVVYEAGYSGFWIYRQLTALGIHCMVVHPGDVGTTDKERR